MKYGLIILHIDGDCEMTVGECHEVRKRGQFSKKNHWTFWNIERGKGFKKLEDERTVSVGSGLIIPCMPAAIGAIRDFLDMQRMLYSAEHARRHEEEFQEPRGYNGPYYFSQQMRANYQFETTKRKTASFGGRDTAYRRALLKNDRATWDKIETLRKKLPAAWAEVEKDTRFKNSLDAKLIYEGMKGRLKRPHIYDHAPFARYNCWTGFQGIAQYIAGLDLGDISDDLPFFYRAFHAQNWVMDIYDRLEAGIKTGDTGEYEILSKKAGVQIIARKKGQPPFIISPVPIYMNRDLLKTELPAALNKRMRNGETAHHYFSMLAQAGALFSAKPTMQHRHVVNDGKGAPKLKPEEW